MPDFDFLETVQRIGKPPLDYAYDFATDTFTVLSKKRSKERKSIRTRRRCSARRGKRSRRKSKKKRQEDNEFPPPIPSNQPCAFHVEERGCGGGCKWEGGSCRERVLPMSRMDSRNVRRDT